MVYSGAKQTSSTLERSHGITEAHSKSHKAKARGTKRSKQDVDCGTNPTAQENMSISQSGGRSRKSVEAKPKPNYRTNDDYNQDHRHHDDTIISTIKTTDTTTTVASTTSTTDNTMYPAEWAHTPNKKLQMGK